MRALPYTSCSWGLSTSMWAWYMTISSSMPRHTFRPMCSIRHVSIALSMNPNAWSLLRILVQCMALVDSYHSAVRNCLYRWNPSPVRLSGGAITMRLSDSLVLVSDMRSGIWTVMESFSDHLLARKVAISISDSAEILICRRAPRVIPGVAAA